MRLAAGSTLQTAGSSTCTGVRPKGTWRGCTRGRTDEAGPKSAQTLGPGRAAAESIGAAGALTSLYRLDHTALQRPLTDGAPPKRDTELSRSSETVCDGGAGSSRSPARQLLVCTCCDWEGCVDSGGWSCEVTHQFQRFIRILGGPPAPTRGANVCPKVTVEIAGHQFGIGLKIFKYIGPCTPIPRVPARGGVRWYPSAGGGGGRVMRTALACGGLG